MNDNTMEPLLKDTSSAPLPKILRISYYLTLIASMIGAFLQMVLLLSEYEIEIGMYRRSSPLALLFGIFALLVTIGILSLPILVKRTSTPEITTLPPADGPVRFASALSGFILLAVLILSLFIGMPGTHGLNPISDFFWLAVVVLLVPTALFFLFPLLPFKQNERVETALAFFPVLWCAAYLMSVNFNNSIALRSPVRILTELAIIASMLFFTMELRVRIGKPHSALLLTFINASIFFSAICALPLISVAFINQWELTTAILYSAVQLCFLTYFIARANTLVRAR